ncbi:MAG: response regulator, partial [Halobacteriales archaeon]|nr:response regulator [Halobacteriales archaeon]
MRRILVIDDEPDVRESLEGLLGLLPDCEVRSAANFAEGKAKMLAEHWDVIFSDQRLPDGRGVDILAEAARARPEAVRVLMSAFQDFDALLRGVNAAHIDHFIQKPWGPTDVLDWTEKLLDARGQGKVPE